MRFGGAKQSHYWCVGESKVKCINVLKIFENRSGITTNSHKLLLIKVKD